MHAYRVELTFGDGEVREHMCEREPENWQGCCLLYLASDTYLLVPWQVLRQVGVSPAVLPEAGG